MQADHPRENQPVDGAPTSGASAPPPSSLAAPAPPASPSPPASSVDPTTAQRRALRASVVQLASPFVYSGLLLAGLVWEIPIGRSASGGYLLIFAFLGSLVLMIVAIGLAGTAALLLQRRNRVGAVLLCLAAGLACVESLGVALGFPAGMAELEPVRVVTIVVGVVWLAVSAACLVVGVRAFRALAPAPPGPGAGAI